MGMSGNSSRIRRTMAGVWAAFPASEAITFALTLYLLKRGERTAKA